jgi:hypothetical protein
MWGSAALVLVLLAALAPQAVGQSSRASERPVLTAWLIPFEPVDGRWDRRLSSAEVQRAISDFEHRYGKGRPVSLLDVTDPALRANLSGWNPEYGSLTWATVLSQVSTLGALERFAIANGVQVRARFLPWGRMLPELRQALASRGRVALEIPDVAQVGSTWTPYLARQGAHPAEPDSAPPRALPWRAIPAAPRSALTYTADVRVLLYRRRLRWEPDTATCRLETRTWESLLISLGVCNGLAGERAGPPIAHPLGLSYNLIHDLLPMMAERSDTLFRHRWPASVHVDLTSASALQIPLLLARRSAVDGRQLVAWPELTNNEAFPHFIDGQYRGLIVPLVFLRIWRESSRRTGQTAAEFWDEAGVAVPPTAIRGGSDLMVFSSPPATRARLAWRLARSLATDSAHAGRLAELGHLPAHTPDGGIDRFLATLDIPDPELAASLRATVAEAETRGIEHPLEPWWTTQVEDPTVLEAFQRFGRRIALGNDDGNAENRVRAAAAEVQATLNMRLDGWVQAWASVRRYWPAASLVIVLLGGFALSQLRRAQKRGDNALLALLLVLSKQHSEGHNTGETLVDMAALTPPEELPERLVHYGACILPAFRRHASDVTLDVCLDVAGERPPIDLRTIVCRALDGAKREYRMTFAKDPPSLGTDIQAELGAWVPKRGPHVLTMAVQEWFYNSFTAAGPRTSAQSPIRAAYVVDRGQFVLRITTPAPITGEDGARLERPVTTLDDLRKHRLGSERPRGRVRAAEPARSTARAWWERVVQRADRRDAALGDPASDETASRETAPGAPGNRYEHRPAEGQGLGLIRDLLHYGLGATARVRGNGPITLEIILPVRRNGDA